MLVLYGIPNCDTVKKARNWLNAAEIGHHFHDFRTAGLELAMVQRWAAALGWEPLLNRAGTTFRELPEAERAAIDAGRAMALMVEQPTLVKRPVLEGMVGGKPVLLVGFKPAHWASVLDL